MKTNCPNCGAPKEIFEIKCPFCGTRYIDIEELNLFEPTYLKINLGTEERPHRAIIRAALVRVESEIALESVPTVTMEFHVLPDANRNYAYIKD